jgi:hypothetical protein
VSEFLSEYLRRGLSDIVVLSHDSEEETTGYEYRHVREEVVARKDGKSVRMSLHQETKYGPRSGVDIDVAQTEIPDAEYQRLTKDRDVIDTPDRHQDYQKQRERNDRRAELKQQLEGIAPACSVCGGKLQPKSGKYGPFWSCSKFHGKTKSLSAEALKLYQEYAGL